MAQNPEKLWLDCKGSRCSLFVSLQTSRSITPGLLFTQGKLNQTQMCFKNCFKYPPKMFSPYDNDASCDQSRQTFKTPLSQSDPSWFFLAVAAVVLQRKP